MGKVTLKDIAERLNISIVAVSKALNDKEGISVKLKKRVKETALEMGYEEAVLKHERELCPKIVAIVVNEIAINPKNMTQAFYLEFFAKLSSMLLDKGYYSELFVLSLEDQRRRRMPSICSNGNVKGIIFLGEIDHDYILEAGNLKQSIVLLDFYDADSDVAAVVTDNMNCSYELTKSLIRKGHKNIGFVGRKNATSSIQDRYMGFYKAMLEKDFPVREEWIINDRDSNGLYVDIQLPEKLPTAFVCNSDRAAYGTILKLKERGLKVPTDVSVVGFDNDLFSLVSEPHLTTVAVNMNEMSAKTVELLMSGFGGADLKLGKISVSGNIVERDSVALPRNRA